MIIYKEDINKFDDKLPVKRGCSGPCGCIGTCQQIIGWIDKQKYLEFINSFKSVEEFISETYEKVQHKPIEEREYKIFINIDNKISAYKELKDLQIENLSEIISTPDTAIYIKDFDSLKRILPRIGNFGYIKLDICQRKTDNDWVKLDKDDYDHIMKYHIL